ncbi:hypothetical protein [Halorhabdus sp. CUG00001]|uniref:hypothetical protein n=1 Tax=Halorhabdus sp. CUG00001 TaxID=2600297 RepID=UPI00131DED58|nr:hypothetical protein [Halorhabdus sp. CUG00001]
MKGKTIFTTTDLKQALRTLLPPLVISVTLPAAGLIYIMLIFSIPLLRSPFWIPDFIIPICIGLYTGSIPAIFYYLVKQKRLPKLWYDYISELISSILLLTVSVFLILTQTGTEPFEQTGGSSVQITSSMVGTLLLIMFSTLGIFFANIHFLYPKIQSTLKNTVSHLKSTFLPPFDAPKTTTQSFNQPEISQNKSLHAFFVGGICIFSIWVLPVLAQRRGELKDLIEGHATLIWYLRDILSGDPEKAIDGWVGPVEEIVAILDPVVIGIYLVILGLTLSFAISWIYFVRFLQERIRRSSGLSRMGITAISTSISIPLLGISWAIADSLVRNAWAIITLVFA